MRQIIILTLTLAFYTFGFSQLASSNLKTKTHQAFKMQHLEGQLLNKHGFIQSHLQSMGLNSPSDFVELKTINDFNGWSRIKYKQQYQGLPVIGGSYTLHEKEGEIKKASGNILPFIDVETSAQIPASRANTIASNYMDHLIRLHNPQIESISWELQNNGLCVIDKDFPQVSGDYLLAHQIIVSYEEDLDYPVKQQFYINAQTGQIIDNYTLIAHTSVEGLALTKFYGQQVIVADSIAPDLFILEDYTRGEGVITRKGNGDDYTDEDNYWDNFNDQKEEVGGDAHYCGSKYYDFMLEKFDFHGIDGNGGAIISWVYGSERNLVNAYWNGTRATFGSGDCDDYDPLTTLTVVGHEFAHGFTEFTSGLIYRDESGALNEAISDIFGKALEYEYDFDNFSWLIGDKFLIDPEVLPFRSMSDPKLRDDPNYYGGEFWRIGGGDNGGVHTNSGVLNYWFYLLTEGVSGTNEEGYNFDVAPIGLSTALQIVFSMNIGYLTEGSTYINAMTASLAACDDLYGPNSSQKESVIEAWRAVGLSPDAADLDMRIILPEDSYVLCAGENSVPIDVQIINMGLNTFNAGFELQLSYSLDNIVRATETLALSQDFLPGDTISYTFSHQEILEDIARDYTLVVTIDNEEVNELNNSFEGEIENIDSEGLDINLVNVSVSKQFLCNPESATRMRAIFRNTGCRVIERTSIPGILMVDGTPIEVTVDLSFDLNVGSTAALTDVIEIEQPLTTISEISLDLNLEGDLNPDNDNIDGFLIAFESIEDGYLQEFNEDFSIYDDDNLSIDPDAFSFAQIVDYNGESMIGFSGEDPDPFRIEACTNDEIFFRENYQLTEIEFCVDVGEMQKPILSFDLVQYHSDSLFEDLPIEYGAMAKVYFEDTEFPVIYGQTEGDIVHHEFELPVGYQDLVTIEVLTLRGNEGAFIGDDLSQWDYVLMDNLSLFDDVVSTTKVESSSINVFPNPAKSTVNFRGKGDFSQYDLSIYNNLGVQLHQSRSNAGLAFWNSQQASPGIYYYKIEYAKGKVKTGKIVIAD